MRMLRLLLGVMALAPTCAVAGEPTGFEGFAFGTTRSALVVEPIFRDRCHPAPVTRPGARVQESRVTCPTYDLNDLGAMRVAFPLLGGGPARRLCHVHCSGLPERRAHQDRVLVRPPDPSIGAGADDRVAVAIRDRSIPDLPLPWHGRVPYREGKGARKERRA